MIYDNDAEVCRQCTLKHLTTAMVSLVDEDPPEILRKVYFNGNLSHAANHFVKLNEVVAEEMRALRIDAQDDRLGFKLPIADIKERLLGIIEKVTNFDPPKPQESAKAVVKLPETTEASPKPAKRGCPCRANH